MRIGFIGAGKMGFTLGKHLVNNSDMLKVAGYYSKNPESAKQAAKFTGTNYYEKLEDLIIECDAIFITVPDGQIAVIADMLSGLDKSLTDGKIVCHTSGALSSQVFSGIEGIFGYSIHPMYAVSSKLESYINFNQSFITIEGNPRYIDYFENVFKSMGHGVRTISANDKVKYHAAAVFSSNLVIGLFSAATELLSQCGFTESEAQDALKPLFINNAMKLENTSPVEALTGPVERCDIDTVRKHMKALNGEYAGIYKLLSEKLVGVALNKKLPDADNEQKRELVIKYRELIDILQQ